MRTEAAPPAQICCFRCSSDLQAVVTLQAVIGSHHHVPVPPPPALIKEKEVLLIQNLGLLATFLSSNKNKVGQVDRGQSGQDLNLLHLLHEQLRGLLLPLLQIILHLQEASDGELPAIVRTEVLQLRLRLTCSRTEMVPLSLASSGM